MKKLLTRTMLLLAATLSIFTACDNSETRVEDPVYADDITLSEYSIEILEGSEDPYILTATVTPDGTTAEGIEWASRNTSIATIDENGKIFGVGDGETAIIAVSADGTKVSKECIVKVNAKVDEVTLMVTDDVNPSAASTWVELKEFEGSFANKIQTVRALITPANAYIKAVEWETTDDSIVAVEPYEVTNEDGTVETYCKISPKAEEEDLDTDTDEDADADVDDAEPTDRVAMISVTTENESKSDNCTFTIETVYATGATIQGDCTIKYGETMQLEGNMDPYYANNKAYWISSDKNIVKVGSTTGIIEGTGTGEATITYIVMNQDVALGPLYTKTCKVNVTAVYATSMELDPAEATINVGGEPLTITPVFVDQNPSDKTAQWSSSDESVATVDENGVVTALKVGTTTITAIANGIESDAAELKATSEITVGWTYVTDFTLAESEEGLELITGAGSTYTFAPEFTPADASDKSIKWESSNPEIATVDENGVLTVVTAGETTITATANGIEDDAEALIKTVKVTILRVYADIIAIEQSETSYYENFGSVQLTTKFEQEQQPTDASASWTIAPADKGVTIDAESGMLAIGDVGDEAVEFTVTATANGSNPESESASATYTFTVKPTFAPTGVVISSTATSVIEGKTLQLTGTIKPEDASVRELVWTSSDDSIATVDANGLVTSVAVGTVTITATVKGTEVEASIEIAVVADPVEITVDTTAGGLDAAMKAKFGDDYATKTLDKVIVTGTLDATKNTNSDIVALQNIKAIDLSGITNTAFAANGFLNNKIIEELILPAKLAVVPGALCSGCTNLKSVTWPSTASFKVAYSAFSGCTSLEQPAQSDIDRMSDFGSGTFANCSKFTSFTFGSLVKQVNVNVFQNCKSLESVVIPATVITMVGNAFNGITNETKTITVGWTEANLPTIKENSATNKLVTPTSIEKVRTAFPSAYSKGGSYYLTFPEGADIAKIKATEIELADGKTTWGECFNCEASDVE